jgi:hypothetical protein
MICNHLTIKRMKILVSTAYLQTSAYFSWMQKHPKIFTTLVL